MIKIIAIQPEVMFSPTGIREYLKDFGTARGRWIPLVPNDWRTCVSQAIKERTDLSVVEKNNLRDKIVHPRNRDKFLKVDGISEMAGGWHELVNDFLARKDFDGAIVSSPDDSNPQFMVAHQFDPEAESYSVKTSGFLPRKPDELVTPIVPILRFAKELHVIDPYCFSAGSSTDSYARFFEGLLMACRKHNPKLKIVTLHRRCPESLDRENERKNYESWILPILKEGESFRVHYLEELPGGDNIHLRAVFTARALVTGHYGFGGDAVYETTDVVLREHMDLLKIRGDYLDERRRAFKFHDPPLEINFRKP